MSHGESGVLQQCNWSKFSYKALTAMRSSSWGHKLVERPLEETLQGLGKRDIGRVLNLLILPKDVRSECAVYAPQEVICSNEVTRTGYFKDLMMEVMKARMGILDGWTSETCVPLFDVRRAAGKAGQWNHCQPHEYKGSKRQIYRPLLSEGTPNHDLLEDLRTNQQQRSPYARPVPSTDRACRLLVGVQK